MIISSNVHCSAICCCNKGFVNFSPWFHSYGKVALKTLYFQWLQCGVVLLSRYSSAARTCSTQRPTVFKAFLCVSNLPNVAVALLCCCCCLLYQKQQQRRQKRNVAHKNANGRLIINCKLNLREFDQTETQLQVRRTYVYVPM